MNMTFCKHAILNIEHFDIEMIEITYFSSFLFQVLIEYVTISLLCTLTEHVLSRTLNMPSYQKLLSNDIIECPQ